MDLHALALPPGDAGLPLVGEALRFARDPFAFAVDRAARHGGVVRSRILDQDLALLSGPDTAAAFLDEENVQRAGGLPPHAAALFGEGVVNQLDGDAHRVRKQHLMRAVDLPALAAYLPDIRAILRERLARWQAAGEVRLQDEAILATLALTMGNFAGERLDDAALGRLAQGYADFARALIGLPLALPGTPLHRARRFTAERHAHFAGLAAARRLAPGIDAVSRLVASEVEGNALSDAEIGRELQHLVFAASGLWGWFCLATRLLAEDAALRGRLQAAVASLPDAPSARQYGELADLDAFVREVKRLGLVIPITAFGVARRDFEVAGHRVPKGWLVTWSTLASHTVPGLSPYSDPDRVDLDRYAAPRLEGAGPHGFAPQGPGDAHRSHRCAGVEYSSLVMQVFAVELLRGPAPSLPAQDFTQDRSGLPATWRSGLRVRFG
jgi:fatty-acid peroxygenase